MAPGEKALEMKDLIFNARDEAYKRPYGAAEAGGTVVFCLYPERYHGVYEASLFIAEDGNDREQRRIPLQWRGLEGCRDHYEGAYTVPRPGLYWYYFRVSTSHGVFYISRGYGSKGEMAAELSARFQLTAYDGAYKVPRWFGEGITYNIFPDRFRRTSVPPEDGYPAERHVHKNWGDVPDYRPDKRGEILNNDFFGGSLRGITEKLDYLASLRVSTLYLNPIFEAFSNHRYDTGDYKKIDPMLGTEEDFATLCAEAAERGIRVMLDGVFNHTGFDSRYFNGRGHYPGQGAHQSKDSPYFDWFDFQEWPDKYSSWWGIYTLPQVREDSPAYIDYIIEGEDSVIRHWLRLGASGWRLDVADELPDWFIQKIDAVVKEEKPDGLVLGEVWEDASNKVAYDERRRYFQGGELDSVMNYPLREAILAFVTGGTAEHFAERIETLRENYPHDIFYNLMNIIGTHDTPRILSVLGGEPDVWEMDRDYRAYHMLPPGVLEGAKRRLRLAAVLQFTMPGSPCIYYGDEAGMQGYEDPFNRRTYPWGKEDPEILSFYRMLCETRDGSAALRRGDLHFIRMDEGVLVYARCIGEECVIIAVNREGDMRSVFLPCLAAEDMLRGGGAYTCANGESGTQVILEPESAMILRCEGVMRERCRNH